YLLFTLEEAEALVRQMCNNNVISFTDQDELAVSALQEAGNILAGSYITSLSDFTNINMQPSVPHLSVDMAGAILTVGLLQVSEVYDFAIIINTKIIDTEESNQGINGQLLLLPSPESFTKIFQALGIQDHE